MQRIQEDEALRRILEGTASETGFALHFDHLHKSCRIDPISSLRSRTPRTV